MPEIFKDIHSFQLSDSQNHYHVSYDAAMARMSPYNSSNGSPLGSIESPLSAIAMADDENLQFGYNEHEFITLSAAMTPEIAILDQPVDKFRFRYKSEMLGTHGSLSISNSSSRKKRQAPTIQLLNFPGTATIRCTLVTKNEERRFPHAHHLVKREGNYENDSPYEIEVSKDNNWIATFHGMGIIHTAKKHIKDELIKKLRREALERIHRQDPNQDLSVREDTQIKMEAANAQKWMDLNSVALCFQAFVLNHNGIMMPITSPVYSNTINNLKSALTGELKICRIDKYVSSCEGGEEVFILVEKVGKKNIKIKFFEMDEKDNEIWSAYGRFSELDVHHQYAIVFRTPPYKDREITSPREVYLQLERITDGDCSEPMKFTYKPTDSLHRKRPRMSFSENIDFNNPILPDVTMSKNSFATPIMTSRDLSEEVRKLAVEKMSSDEFKKILEDIDISDYMALNQAGAMDYETDLCFDGAASDDNIEGPRFAMNSLKMALKKANGDTTKLQKYLNSMLKERTSYGDTPLHSALRHGQREVVKYILCILGSSSKFNHLIDMKNASGKTPLHYAVILNQPDIVKALLTLGANPNMCDNHGSYALHEAVKRPDTWECVVALLDAGASYKEVDDAGWTALQLAAEAGSVKAFEALMTAGADVNSTERSFGRTALHIAVEGGHIELVRYILEKTTIDVNQQNLGGNTALHAAVVTTGSRAKDLCELLTKHGADPYIPNGHPTNTDREQATVKTEIVEDEKESMEGQTSFDLAAGNDEIQSLFIDNTERELDTELPVECKIKEEAKSEPDSMVQWLDVDEMATLADILEKNDGWQPLANCIGCDYLSSSLELSGASPALTILSFAAVQGSVTISKLLNILHELKQTEATTFIEDVIRNQSQPH